MNLIYYQSNELIFTYLSQYDYTMNKTTLKTLIKLPDWRKTIHNCRVMGHVWVLFLLFAYTRPIYPTYFAGSLYIYSSYYGYNYSFLMLTNVIGNSYMSDSFAKMTPI